MRRHHALKITAFFEIQALTQFAEGSVNHIHLQIAAPRHIAKDNTYKQPASHNNDAEW